MCFADARGIPKEFLDGTGPFRVKGSLTIPLLHDAMTGSLRNSLQKQLDPANPNVGVDANRDYYESLVSTRTFRAFMDNIKAGCDTSGNNMRTTTTIIYDTVDSKELDPITCSTVRYLCVLMIHGYEEGGAVYGPYAVARKEPNQEWPARMSDADKAYVNDIRSELSWGELGKISISAENFNNDNPPDDPYLYGKKYSEEEQRRTSIRSNATEYDAREYRGEWSTSLYLKNIWSADIELPQGAYDEGIRGDPGRPYEEQMGRIGNLGVVFNQFVNLLGNFPWQDE
jgi:hypothetical protein